MESWPHGTMSIMSQSKWKKKKRKKKRVVRFLTHVSPTHLPLNSPPLLFLSKYLPFGRLALHSSHFILFFFIILSQTPNNPLSHSLTLPLVHHSTTSTIIFWQVLLKKLHKNLLSSYISSYLREELLYFLWVFIFCLRFL